MVWRDEEVGRETFLLVHQSKGFAWGRRREAFRRGKESLSSPLLDRDRILAAMTIWSGTIMSMKLVHDPVAVETLRIVRQDREFEISQPIQRGLRCK